MSSELHMLVLSCSIRLSSRGKSNRVEQVLISDSLAGISMARSSGSADAARP